MHGLNTHSAWNLFLENFQAQPRWKMSLLFSHEMLTQDGWHYAQFWREKLKDRTILRNIFELPLREEGLQKIAKSCGYQPNVKAIIEENEAFFATEFLIGASPLFNM